MHQPAMGIEWSRTPGIESRNFIAFNSTSSRDVTLSPERDIAHAPGTVASRL